MALIESTADFIEFLGCGIPEKKSAFDSLISQLGVTFSLDESTNAKVFNANSKTKSISVGQKGIERLWAHAYGYAAVFSATAWNHENGRILFDTKGKPIFDEASQLLTWSVGAEMALKEDKTVPIADQPSGTPSPVDASDDGTVLSLAQSLWCHALCFILFHELVHIQFGHSRQVGLANVEQEKDADREAARWLLEDTEGTERRQIERRFGVATALIYLAVTDVYLPGRHSDDYPPGYDRLFQTLSQYFFEHDVEDSEQVWAFVSICLMLHIHNKRIPLVSDSLRGSWQQIADALVNVLANCKAN